MADYLETEELEALINAIDRPRDRLLVQFLVESGCSISEVAAIRAEQLGNDGVLSLSSRVIMISPLLAQTLLAQARSHLFWSRQTSTITPKRIQQILKPYLTAVHHGSKKTPHVLRYTHIVHAYTQGVPIRAISSQTGLTPVRIAQIVADVPPPKQYPFRSPLGGVLSTTVSLRHHGRGTRTVQSPEPRLVVTSRKSLRRGGGA